MRWEDTKASIKDFWSEYRKQKTGMLGLALLILLILTAVFDSHIVPAEVREKWGDVTYWENNPRSVPPAWINYLTDKDLTPHKVLRNYSYRETSLGNIKTGVLLFKYDYKYDEPPTDVILELGVRYYNEEKPPTVVVYWVRPDRREIQLLSKRLSGAPLEDKGYVESSERFLLTKDSDVRSQLYSFASEYETPENLAKLPPDLVDITRVMFSKAEPGIIMENTAKPLKGVYQLKTEIFFFDERDSVENASVTFAGRAYGILGTDDLRRDIFQGVIVGVRVALLLGMLYAIIAVSIGVIYGITSAYLGGWTDEIMQHINFGWASIPVLPLLILIAAVWKPSIWNIVLLLSIFGWVGVARVARSMGLQLKEETYVEAAKAMGAGTRRIIFKHIIPQVAPYAFASMALAVPAAILWEAGLSFLGLGDPKVVTWGKILHEAHDAGATINGMWWWVVPPGLAIALVGLTFVLVGTALDTVLNPKMRRI